MSNSLGSYYVSLGMQADHDSFNKGKMSVEGITNSVSRLIGTVRNASVIVATGLGTIATATGSLAAKDLMLAESMNMSTKSLKAWQSTARMSHTDAAALVGKIAELDTRAWRLTKDGKADNELLESWEKLRHAASETNAEFKNIKDEDFLQMSADDRAKTILRMGQAIKDKTDAAMYVGDLLGSAGKDITTYLHMTGKDIDTLFNDGMSRVFETEEGMKAGMKFHEEFGKTVENMKSISSETSNQLGGQLVPVFEKLNGYFKDHGAEITERLTGFSKDIGKIANALAPLVGTTIKTAINMLLDLTGAVSALLTGDWDKVGEKLKQFFRDFRNGIVSLVYGKEYADELQEIDRQYAAGEITTKEKQNKIEYVLYNKKHDDRVKENKDNNIKTRLGITNDNDMKRYHNLEDKLTALNNEAVDNFSANHKKQLTYNKAMLHESDLPLSMQTEIEHFGGVGKFRRWIREETTPSAKIQDGIIRPNGQVTQVAPDDWVFALRDVGKLTNALAPQNEPALAMRSWGALLEEMQRGVKEFIPSTTVHNTTNAPQHITIQINQTVTSTSNDWLPQTIKEQISLGVQDGMQQAKDGFRRLQMMSGTL